MTQPDPRRPVRDSRASRTVAALYCLVVIGLVSAALGHTYRTSPHDYGRMAPMAVIILGALAGGIFICTRRKIPSSSAPARQDGRMEIIDPIDAAPAEFAFIVRTVRAAPAAQLAELDEIAALMPGFGEARERVESLLRDEYAVPELLDLLVELDRASAAAAAVGALTLVGDKDEIDPMCFGTVLAPWLEADFPIQLGDRVFYPGDLPSRVRPVQAVDLDDFVKHVVARSAAGLTRAPSPH